MKLVRYSTENRRPSYGIRTPDGIIDLARRLPYPDLDTLLCDPDGMTAARATQDAAPDVDLNAVITWLPPVARPSKIFCIGVNYDAHRRETGRDPTAHPTVFTRFAHTLVGHGQALVRPAVSERFDYEGELAVIIGRGGRRIGAEHALAHVAGYACFNDGSVRDYQRHTSQFTPGKNFDHTGGFGPWLLTADEVADPQALTLETRLAQEVMQRAPTAHMIFSVTAIIEYISSFCTLMPGDVIATGTPGGVGDKRHPPRYMQPGEEVEVDIEGIGTLCNPIVLEKT